MVNVQLPKVLFRDFNSTYNVYCTISSFVTQCGIWYCNSKRGEIAVCKGNATCA